MSFKVKIYGAGSIGNHLAHASRSLGWEVDVCDIDAAALERMRSEIYPGRYGKWDESIQLYQNQAAPRGIYDLIFIGTPPEFHLTLALDALQEKPKAILVEKPLCGPDLAKAQEFYELAQKQGVLVCGGYDHVVGMATCKLEETLQTAFLGDIETIDVEFREHWGGIFAAHPWLKGPSDSYLGYWQRGGGASGEHSHAINLWQHFAHLVGAGRVIEVSAMLHYINHEGATYDKICALNLKTESGLVGRVVQDVVTKPPRKWGRIQGSEGYLEWHCGFKPGCDAVFYGNHHHTPQEHLIQKTRPDDFIWELRHLEQWIATPSRGSGIAIERGLDTMLVVAAAHLSAQHQKNIRIDYSQGYTSEALQLF